MLPNGFPVGLEDPRDAPLHPVVAIDTMPSAGSSRAVFVKTRAARFSRSRHIENQGSITRILQQRLYPSNGFIDSGRGISYPIDLAAQYAPSAFLAAAHLPPLD